MEYKVVQAHSTEDLTELVNKYIEKGWKPKGSHKVTVSSSVYQRARTQKVNYYKYSQTLIKEGQ